MKNNALLVLGYRVAGQGLLISLTLAISASTIAQNFVKNADFEEPLGPDNWTVEYAAVIGGNVSAANRPTNSGPDDFLIKGRTCQAQRGLVPALPFPDQSDTWDGEDGTGTNYWNKYGAHLMPNHTWVCHAYFKQIVTNLTPGASYVVSAWMTQFGKVDKADVYLESLGGPGGALSIRTPAVTNDARANPYGWKKYAVTNTASTNGQIVVRLHMNKNYTDMSSLWSYRQINAFFDHVAVIPVGQASYLPSYTILSLERTNERIALTTETVINNRYRIQVSTNPANPASWVMLERERNVDTNFLAAGTNLTFVTNVSSLFFYISNSTVPNYFDSDVPLYFRMYSESFKP